jgi:RNA polymerase sigma-70 factor (ECF subfamily)
MWSEDVDRLYREWFGRAVGILGRTFRDLDLAEEAVQDAFTAALTRWERDGIPAEPGAWIVTAARNRAIDVIRRRAVGGERERQAFETAEEPPEEDPGGIADERLRLLFVCCHPSLPREAQLALTLRLVAGLTVDEIARAFLTTGPTIAQRLVRAKRRVRDEDLSFRVPDDHELTDRLEVVLAVLYQLYTEGHTTTAGEDGVRDTLSLEAIRLARLLVELMPDEPDAQGLLALLVTTQARRPARLDAAGALVALEDHDRSQYDRALATEGDHLVREALRRRAGPYALQAAISALHTGASSFAETDWPQIVSLYDRLCAVAPSPVTEIARAVAVSYAYGPSVALAFLDAIGERGGLADHAPLHAARADLHRRMGNAALAASAYRLAIVSTRNPLERAFLATRLASVAI